VFSQTDYEVQRLTENTELNFDSAIKVVKELITPGCVHSGGQHVMVGVIVHQTVLTLLMQPSKHSGK